MKISRLLLPVLALAFTACDRDSSSPGNTAVVNEKVDGVAQMGATSTSARVARKIGVADTRFSGAPASLRTMDTARPESPPSEADPLQTIGAATIASTMVIRTGQAFIESNKVDSAVTKIRQLAAQVGGYITNSSISGGRDQIRQATLELKLPATKYDDAVGSLSTIGKVETVNSSAQDVGEEFVDVTARATNSRRLEERLISLLANRTGKLQDVLLVERELARVREEIERYQGRLRYLSARVAMSTLTVTVHEPAPILGNTPGANPIAAALRRAWKNFVAVIAGSIASLGVVIPLALVGLAGWLAYRRWKRA